MNNKKKHDIEGIYKITCLGNNKVYIGESKSIYKRWFDHKRTLKQNNHHNQHLQNAWNKYGDLYFKFEVLEKLENSTKQERLQLENKYCILFNTYNSTGGFNVRIDTETSTEERNESKRIYKRVYQLHKETGEIIKIWDSRLEIGEAFGLSYKKTEGIILGAFINKGRRKCYKDCIWVLESKYDPNIDYPSLVKKVRNYVKKEKPPKKVRVSINKKSISLQNINTLEVREFESRTQAAKELGFSKAVICSLLKGYKSKGGGRIVKISQWRGWKIVQ